MATATAFFPDRLTGHEAVDGSRVVAAVVAEKIRRVVTHKTAKGNKRLFISLPRAEADPAGVELISPRAKLFAE